MYSSTCTDDRREALGGAHGRGATDPSLPPDRGGPLRVPKRGMVRDPLDPRRRSTRLYETSIRRMMVGTSGHWTTSSRKSLTKTRDCWTDSPTPVVVTDRTCPRQMGDEEIQVSSGIGEQFSLPIDSPNWPGSGVTVPSSLRSATAPGRASEERETVRVWPWS